jgi:hypothetical protein
VGAGVAGVGIGVVGNGVVGEGAEGAVGDVGKANPVRLDRLVVFCASTAEQDSASRTGRSARMNLKAGMVINPDVLES